MYASLYIMRWSFLHRVREAKKGKQQTKEKDPFDGDDGEGDPFADDDDEDPFA